MTIIIIVRVGPVMLLFRANRTFSKTLLNQLTSHGSVVVVSALASGCCGDVPEMDSTYVDAFKEAQCGNGVIDEWEECDDGDMNSDAGPCSRECIRVGCGDGLIDDGEECDDGELNLDQDYGAGCSVECKVLPWCGDGVVQPEHEECDDGDLDNNNACLTTCEAASCGDGHLHTGSEACDDGNHNPVDGCTNECELPGCGNGVVEGDEECDDGNADETDACTSQCKDASCGDGHTQAVVDEECDDGNEVYDDGCNNDCARDRVVFVTSEVFQGGDFGSLDGADAECRALASAAELENAQSFRAWLSDESGAPTTRFLQSRGRYVLLDGREVASNWDDLVDGMLWTTIDVTEVAEQIPGSAVWSNTGIDGSLAEDPADCEDWTSSSGSHEGRQGAFVFNDAGWTDVDMFNPGPCNDVAFLYCFEQ